MAERTSGKSVPPEEAWEPAGGGPDCICSVSMQQVEGRPWSTWSYKTACPTKMEDHPQWDERFRELWNSGSGMGFIGDLGALIINDGQVSPPSLLTGGYFLGRSFR
jgi:hypothetical protein